MQEEKKAAKTGFGGAKALHHAASIMQVSRGQVGGWGGRGAGKEEGKEVGGKGEERKGGAGVEGREGRGQGREGGGKGVAGG